MSDVRVFYWTESKYLVHNVIPSAADLYHDYKEVPLRPIIADKDAIFEQLNIETNPLGEKGWQDWIGKNLQPSPHTSMSVGDIIQIDDDYWLARIIGWKRLSFKLGILEKQHPCGCRVYKDEIIPCKEHRDKKYRFCEYPDCWTPFIPTLYGTDSYYCKDHGEIEIRPEGNP